MSKPRKSVLMLFLFCLSLLAAQIMPASTEVAQAAAAIHVKVDGRHLSVSQPPVIQNGRMLVPMRDIFEALGARVTWNGANKTATAVQGSTTIVLAIGQKTAKVNQSSKALDEAAQVISGKTMVPVRFVSETFGAKVIWNEHARTVAVVTPKLANQKADLTIAAAASLTDALNELKTSFNADYPNYHLTFTFGSSGKLATQIQQGAPADVFLSASKKDMDTLEASKLIAPSTRVNFAENRLVLVAPKDTKLPVAGFDKINPDAIKQMAIGNPDSVPAGRYAKETLTNVGLWDKLQSKIVFASDVRQVLTYVESGNVDVGAVYTSDALSTDKVKILAIADTKWHSPIVYPGAVVNTSTFASEADVFLDYLNSEKAMLILSKHGFYVK
ncbi:molybdate ABC transporter substrate-binding protein [Brevibacillus fluminis]|uniref:molybdate ABC transporter substrate-binding protein n=1 Tax=Brevibacillus fluminis TaxID=511487 RepID=UPI003F88E488